MKEIKLTQGKVALVDDVDYDFLMQWRWFADKSASTFYARRNGTDNGRRTNVKMHRVILGITDPSTECDHIDGNGLNNQRSNIRPSTKQENRRNRVSYKGSKSKYKGVFYEDVKGKWRAIIGHNGKSIHIGYYKSEKEAAIAYNNAAPKYHGEFARLNSV